MLNPEVILLFIISFLDLALGLFVLLKNPKARINRSFALFTLSGLVWMVASFFEDESKNMALRYFLLKLDFATGIFVSFLLLIFCLEISKSEVLEKPYAKKLLIAIPAIFSLLIFFTGFILSGYTMAEGVITPVFGSAGVIYDFFIGVSLAFGVGTLLWKYRESSAEDKAKFIYLFIGFFLTSVIGFVTNIWLADFIKNSPHYELYSRLGLFSSIFVILFSGYAIVKHRLLNLKIIATELLSLGILVFSLFQLLLSGTSAALLANGIIFVILLFFVIMLVRSVENEVKRKEELQVASEKLASANERLKELDEARAEFMSFASHQLQTPLTAIRGYASLLLDGSGGELTLSEKDMIGKISASSQRMVELVEDYLNLSRIESGKLEFTFAKWSLENICQEAVEALELKAKGKKLSLTFHHPSHPLPEVVIDGPKVREVISNLVDNAIKYTPDGGVSVDISQKQHQADETTDSIIVTVSDTGLGISKNELPLLFAKFSRGNNEERLKIKGTGLGLYVGKVMIENNGGKIWAESNGEGKGSRFIIELPLNPPKEIKEKADWGGSGARSAG